MTREEFVKLLDYSDESWGVIRRRIIDAWDEQAQTAGAPAKIVVVLKIDGARQPLAPDTFSVRTGDNLEIDIGNLVRKAIRSKPIDFNATGGHMPGCPNLSGGVCDCSGPVEPP